MGTPFRGFQQRMRSKPLEMLACSVTHSQLTRASRQVCNMMAATVSATTESPVLGATGGHFPLASAAISDHIVSVQVPAESKPGQSLRVRTPNGREAELQVRTGCHVG